MKQEVIICDDCKQKVSCNICEMCGKDICSVCSIKRNFHLVNLILCRLCSGNVSEVLNGNTWTRDGFIENFPHLKEIRNDFITYLKKAIVISKATKIDNEN